MKITKIKIENFKSIQNIEFDIKKYGKSYTTMLVGINESGKSNVLEAMSFLNVRKGEHGFTSEFIDYCNQKIEKEVNSINIWFHLEFENTDTCLNAFIEMKTFAEGLLDFKITSIKKNVFLKSDNKWDVEYDYQINGLSKNLFIKVIETNGSRSYQIVKDQDEEKTFQELTEELFRECFHNDIVRIIPKYEPPAIFWRSTDKYLISTVDLNGFANDINTSPVLRNIFLLAGYSIDKMREVIPKISGPKRRNKKRQISRELSKTLNNYLKKIWKHNIEVEIEISDTGKFDIFIRDSGKENEDDGFFMSDRSDGAKHFLSLILSLSIENKTQIRKNQLILIDEPEMHLHPSGIRDISKELLKIGEENFVFVATHSPFLIDKVEKTRNIILKKNDQAATEKREIKDYENFIDDEVLREAFGIEVYRDLLNPHSILVEGASDKIILQKAFKIKGKNDYGITNGHGSNIDTLAAKLNDTGISILIILDDDDNGKTDRDKIINLGGQYSKKNVYTIRDLVGEIKDGGAIEDTLGKEFVESSFKEFYKSEFNETCNLSLNEQYPFINQIKTFLEQQPQIQESLKQKHETIKNTLDQFKKYISDRFDPTAESWEDNFPLLKKLVDAILKKFQSN